MYTTALKILASDVAAQRHPSEQVGMFEEADGPGWMFVPVQGASLHLFLQKVAGKFVESLSRV